MQLKKPNVSRWSRPLFEAYIAGCWMLYWTESTLYWVAKPTIRVERNGDNRRLHHDTYAACESDLENLYFWHGILVPAFVIVRPDWITAEIIQGETNAEVRRAMIERIGAEKYLGMAKAERVQSDDFGILWRVPQENDDPVMIVQVVNSTPEPDGRYKDYFLMVHHELRPLLSDEGELGEPQELTARNAVASTFGKYGHEYAPEFQS